MKKNMGVTDRVTRVIIAAILAVLYFSGVITGTLGIVLLVVAAIFLLTAIFGFCPLYYPFGMKTITAKKNE